MEIEQIIIDYFEGDTNLELERKMFSEIAMDDALIAEFKNFFLIDNAMKASVNSFTSPTSVTNEIFRKLGYSIPPQAKPKWVLFSFLKNNRALSHILSALIASAVTIAVMLLFFFPEGNDSLLSAKQSNTSVTDVSKPSIPVIVSKDNSVDSPIRQKQKLPSIFDNSEGMVTDEQTQSGQENESQLTLSSAMTMPDYKIANTPPGLSKLYYENKYEKKLLLIAEHEPIGLSLGFSGMAMWDIPGARIPSNYIPPFNNHSIMVMYDVSEFLKLGAEIRQERFYTEYSGKEVNDSLYLYNQQTNLTSLSANARYYILEAGYYYPYLGANLGFNYGGFIFRPNAGIEYRIYPDISLTLGLEYTYFLFRHNGDWFGASKAGINYGLLINF